MTPVDAVGRNSHIELVVEHVQYSFTGVVLCLRDAMHNQAITPTVLFYCIKFFSQRFVVVIQVIDSTLERFDSGRNLLVIQGASVVHILFYCVHHTILHQSVRQFGYKALVCKQFGHDDLAYRVNDLLHDTLVRPNQLEDSGTDVDILEGCRNVVVGFTSHPPTLLIFPTGVCHVDSRYIVDSPWPEFMRNRFVEQLQKITMDGATFSDNSARRHFETYLEEAFEKPLPTLSIQAPHAYEVFLATLCQSSIDHSFGSEMCTFKIVGISSTDLLNQCY